MYKGKVGEAEKIGGELSTFIFSTSLIFLSLSSDIIRTFATKIPHTEI